ncbi:hypothetical protein [Streptomyces microflavus]|uniref:hypothetical protein n=1 Tax=Streptomyces microflavus TaxID=1919 RepID=UPI002E33AF1F|nr:hypothetical protein [Streptomyces microflavus]WSS32042.1 hypothetical protein OG269_00515 [Streptomyces microflavus]WST19411.1 hypothetical protein OG721_38130 [Streptomyces microflavus]
MTGNTSPLTSVTGGASDVSNDKRRGLHIQIGKHFDVTLGVYVSPQALVLLCSLGAGAGVGTWFAFLNK